jgi:hypothetical protein
MWLPEALAGPAAALSAPCSARTAAVGTPRIAATQNHIRLTFYWQRVLSLVGQFGTSANTPGLYATSGPQRCCRFAQLFSIGNILCHFQVLLK